MALAGAQVCRASSPSLERPSVRESGDSILVQASGMEIRMLPCGEILDVRLGADQRRLKIFPLLRFRWAGQYGEWRKICEADSITNRAYAWHYDGNVLCMEFSGAIGGMECQTGYRFEQDRVSMRWSARGAAPVPAVDQLWFEYRFGGCNGLPCRVEQNDGRIVVGKFEFDERFLRNLRALSLQVGDMDVAIAWQGRRSRLIKDSRVRWYPSGVVEHGMVMPGAQLYFATDVQVIPGGN